MVFDDTLADRLRAAVAAQLRLQGVKNLSDDVVSEKAMFGGLCIMVHSHMTCGLCGIKQGSQFMVRVGTENCEKALKLPYTRPMDFTGRPMKGFVFVENTVSDQDLGKQVLMAVQNTLSLPAKEVQGRKASRPAPSPKGKRAAVASPNATKKRPRASHR